MITGKKNTSRGFLVRERKDSATPFFELIPIILKCGFILTPTGKNSWYASDEYDDCDPNCDPISRLKRIKVLFYREINEIPESCYGYNSILPPMD